MTPKEVLIAAKALIDTTEKWCQGQGTRGDRMCAEVALSVASHHVGDHVYAVAKRALRAALPGRFVYIHGFNDRRSHPDVMALFDRAIEAAP